MATIITEECINCDACTSECPNNAISAGDQIHVINPTLCSECVGLFAERQCASVCPVDACQPDPNRRESEAELLARSRALHPERQIPDNAPSHFTK